MQGIISLLNEGHATRITAVWASLQDRLGLPGMDVPPFPHVSYHVAEQYEVSLLEPIVCAWAAHTAPFEVETTGLGIFTTGLQPVLYLTVVRHPRLSALQAALWPTLAALSAGIIEYYHPDRWVPHITLHHGNLSPDALAEAVRLLSPMDFRWRLRIDNLVHLHRSAWALSWERRAPARLQKPRWSVALPAKALTYTTGLEEVH